MRDNVSIQANSRDATCNKQHSINSPQELIHVATSSDHTVKYKTWSMHYGDGQDSNCWFSRPVPIASAIRFCNYPFCSLIALSLETLQNTFYFQNHHIYIRDIDYCVDVQSQQLVLKSLLLTL